MRNGRRTRAVRMMERVPPSNMPAMSMILGRKGWGGGTRGVSLGREGKAAMFVGAGAGGHGGRLPGRLTPRRQ